MAPHDTQQKQNSSDKLSQNDNILSIRSLVYKKLKKNILSKFNVVYIYIPCN